MAIQNFISGGFYGKLGAMVGQRWRNKRTLRRYVIPANPQTPLQQANRAKFATSVKLAQVAMNINKGSQAWDTSSVPEFSLRTGTAKRRLALSMTEDQSIPIFPDSFIPSITVTPLLVKKQQGPSPTSLTSTVQGTLVEREIQVLIKLFDLKKDKWIEAYKIYNTVPKATLELKVDLAFHEALPEGSFIMGASKNDSLFEDQSIFIPKQSIEETAPPYRYIYMNPLSILFESTKVTVTYYANEEIWFDPGIIRGNAWVFINGELTYKEDFTECRLLEGRIWEVSAPVGNGYSWGEESIFESIVAEFITSKYYLELEVGEADIST